VKFFFPYAETGSRISFFTPFSPSYYGFAFISTPEVVIEVKPREPYTPPRDTVTIRYLSPVFVEHFANESTRHDVYRSRQHRPVTKRTNVRGNLPSSGIGDADLPLLTLSASVPATENDRPYHSRYIQPRTEGGVVKGLRRARATATCLCFVPVPNVRATHPARTSPEGTRPRCVEWRTGTR